LQPQPNSDSLPEPRIPITAFPKQYLLNPASWLLSRTQARGSDSSIAIGLDPELELDRPGARPRRFDDRNGRPITTMKTHLSSRLCLSPRAIWWKDRGVLSAGDAKANDADRLVGSYRFERSGWIHVHLQGSPDRIGYQQDISLPGENRRLPTGDQALPREVKQTGIGNFYRQGLPSRCSGPHRSEYQREIERKSCGVERQGSPRRSLGSGRPQCQPGAALLLRSLGWTRRKVSRRPLTPPVIAAPSSPRELHQGTVASSWGTRLDELRCRDALEHHSTSNRSRGLGLLMDGFARRDCQR